MIFELIAELTTWIVVGFGCMCFIKGMLIALTDTDVIDGEMLAIGSIFWPICVVIGFFALLILLLKRIYLKLFYK